MYDVGYEVFVGRWLEPPYWQYCTGGKCSRHDFPLSPTRLVKWHRKIGDEACKCLLTQTLQAGKKWSVLKASSLDKVVVDTTRMEKVIAHPVDRKLSNRMRVHSVK